MILNNPVFGLRGGLAALALLLGLWPLAAVAQPGAAWRVVSVSGDARLGGAALRDGQALAPGDSVETGADGRVVLAQDATRVTVSPSSRTEIPAGAAAGRTTLFQAVGTLLLSVERRLEQHFEVQTPYLAAVVKGTTFTVSVNAQGSSVHVVEGLVEVGSFAGGGVSQVRPGQTATVSSRPDAGVKVIGQLAPDGDQPGQSGKTVRAESADATTAGATAAATATLPPQPIERAVKASQALAEGGAAGGSEVILLDRTLGAERLDLATLTGGLISDAPARAQRAALGTGDDAGAAGGGNGAKGRGGLGGLDNGGLASGRVTPGNPGQAISTQIHATASPGAPSRALVGGSSSSGSGSGGGNGLALGLGQAAGNGNANGNRLGNGNGNGNGNSNGLALRLDSASSGGSSVTISNGNGSGLALGLGNGNANGLALGLGKANSNGNGNGSKK